jgi:hypothetical protein
MGEWGIIDNGRKWYKKALVDIVYKGGKWYTKALVDMIMSIMVRSGIQWGIIDNGGNGGIYDVSYCNGRVCLTTTIFVVISTIVIY